MSQGRGQRGSSDRSGTLRAARPALPGLVAVPIWQRWQPWLGALIIILATLISYWPVTSCGYIWDDDDYLTRNIHLRSLEGLLRIWEPLTTRQYYPIVFTTFWLEYQLWELNPIGYHLVNVLLHALNAVLVWRVCRVLNIPGSWVVGAVFALHPVHVESVAWITERKNVLSAFFYLCAMLAYLRFETGEPDALKEPKSKRMRAWGWYVLALMLFVLALLSKSVTCSLPAAIILIRLWQRKDVNAGFLRPLVPLFLIGLILALHTAHLEKVSVGAVGPEFEFSFADRLLIASNALLFYPMKLLLPWPLMFIYPRWTINDADLLSYWPLLVVAAIGLATVILWRRGYRGPFLGLAYFAGTVFPALGFFNVYPMRYSFVADHFQYLASLGIIALAVGTIASVIVNRRIAAALGGSILLAFTVIISQRCWVYQNEETLWRVTKAQNPEAWIAHINLGKLLTDRGDTDEAIEIFTDLVAKHPEMRLARNHLAWSYLRAGRHDEALREYHALQKQYGGYETRLGQAYDAMGKAADAEHWYRAALNTTQEDAGAIVLLSRLLLRRGESEEAVRYLGAYLERMPRDAFAHLMLADALAAADRFDEARQAAEQAKQMAQWLHDPIMLEHVRHHLSEIRAGRVPQNALPSP